MLFCDLHYHANLPRSSRSMTRRKLRRITRTFAANGLDYVASTEHAYKNPLDAYLRLVEAARDLKTAIIPGVEEVSSEGIDIIFLFRDENALRHGLRTVKTFFWSVRDVWRVARDIGAVSIVPHPFHIGVTAAGRVLSPRAYQTLVRNVDYVEIHNGSALNLHQRIHRSRLTPLVPRLMDNLDHTLDLPLHLRGGNETGWSVGSDAHYARDQYVVGALDSSLGEGESFFDRLTRRARFIPYTLKGLSPRTSRNCIHILRDFQGVLREGTIKRCKKTLANAQQVMNF